MEDNKMESSISYILANIFLSRSVLYNTMEFNYALSGGPRVMKKWLANEWDLIKQSYPKLHPNVHLVDENDFISEVDFDVSVCKAPTTNAHIFCITLPEVREEVYDCHSKFLAVAMNKGMTPRYFLYEYPNEREIELHKGEVRYSLCEYVVDEKGSLVHKNYGTDNNDQMSHFATLVINKVENT